MHRGWAVALLMAVGCGQRGGFGSGGGSATCEGVCDHYTACRGGDDSKVYGACLRECGEIFYEDGKPDVASIRQFQRMGCPDVLVFVEGRSGRPPGIKPAVQNAANK